MVNSIGLQNMGMDMFFERHFLLFRRRKTPVIINFFGFTEDEYAMFAARVKEDRLIVALEMNLSCPNIKAGGISFGKSPEMVHRIIKKVKSETTIPVLAKLTPEVNNIVEIAKAAYDAGVDGLTLINTMPGAVIDTRRKKMTIKGGLSGPVLKPIALRAVHECSKAVPVPIIGVGGIAGADDVIAFLMAGACAVQIGSATFVDPYSIPKTISALETCLDQQACKRVRDITGAIYG